MRIHLRNENHATFENDIRALVNAFYPGAETVGTAEDAELSIDVDALMWEDGDRESCSAGIGQNRRFAEKSALKRVLYRYLSGQTGRELPWGTLTGIRPVRIVEMLEAEGLEGSEVTAALRSRFQISDKKIALLTGIAAREKRLLQGIDYRNECSVYLHIPFCPTRCLYCSFASNPIGTGEQDGERTDRYLDCLVREMEQLREGALELRSDNRENTAAVGAAKGGLTGFDQTGGRIAARPYDEIQNIRTVYVGGGTPTALSAAQLDRLLTDIRRIFRIDAIGQFVPSGAVSGLPEESAASGTPLIASVDTADSHRLSGVVEFTVEAGRPDSITREKLEVLKRHGVTRISINPQTFHQKTLDLIDRRHTVEDIYRAYALARSMGFDNINMDLIMGLPGEGIEEVRETLRCVRELRPESLTVHTLAVKRAAPLSTEGKAWGGVARKGSSADAAEAAEIAAMTELGAECAAELGMLPYYIYRQKSMAGNQENVGYALPGKECLYNILMMEEKHTVYGLGAGASTKTVRYGADGTPQVTRTSHPKNLENYMRAMEQNCML